MNELTITTESAIIRTGQALTTFDEAAARFLATRPSEATQSTYGRALALYRTTAAESGFDPFRADCLILFNQEQQAQQRDAGGSLANDTIRIRLKAVQSFFSWAWAFGLTGLKPELITELLTIPPARKLSPRDILTADEARRLLASAGGLDLCLIRVMLDGGLRLAEALALRAEDIYTASDRFFLHVRRGKGNKEREVPIRPDLYRDLKECGAGPSHELLFGDYYPRKVQRLVDKLATAAGIEKRITPHSLRHTLGNSLALAGYPLELIGQMLGHSSYDTTKIYTRPAKVLQQAELPFLPWQER